MQGFGGLEFEYVNFIRPFTGNIIIILPDNTVEYGEHSNNIANRAQTTNTGRKIKNGSYQYNTGFVHEGLDVFTFILY